MRTLARRNLTGPTPAANLEKLLQSPIRDVFRRREDEHLRAAGLALGGDGLRLRRSGIYSASISWKT